MDKNGDGILSQEELIFGFSKICENKEEAENKVKMIINKIDNNFSGKIDYSGIFLLKINNNFEIKVKNLKIINNN